MGFDIIGTLKEKGGIQEITDNFSKREFVIHVPDPNGKVKYDQYYTFTLGNKNCPLIDNWRVDDEIKVYFNLKGRRYNGKGYHDLDAWKIEGMKYDRPVAPPEDRKTSKAFVKEPDAPNSGDDETLPF